MKSRDLDLLVSVDFGTTYTGVSYVTLKEKINTTKTISQWPGDQGSENKVPTVLAKDQSGRDSKWGFHCKDLAFDKQWKLFKLLLDPKVHQAERERKDPSPWIPEDMNEVHGLVVEYLNHIYIHISEIIPKLIKKDRSLSPSLRKNTWESMKVEFIFSTPTTWEAPVSQSFRGLVAEAGFGGENNHSVILGLTEAEAAAVFTCQREGDPEIRDGNILLSIDAGGGTTDLAFVRKKKDSFVLEEIRPVNGIGVGSTQIDWDFTKLIQDRITANPDVRLPDGFALKASQSADFQTLKENFGSKGWDQGAGEYFIEVAGTGNYTHDNFRMTEGKLRITSDELRQCFDTTLQRIRVHIQDVLGEAEFHQMNRGRMQVDYIVISGGLGCSEYILRELQIQFDALARHKNSCLAGSKLLPAKDHTRTIVIRGLLKDRMVRDHALREYVARANYGIFTIPSPRWYRSAKEEIVWKVKYGDTINACQHTTIKITRELPNSAPFKWTEEIVWLSEDRGDHFPTEREDG
ncbi:hypothetical protein HG530_008165 [Fusarium avenaceum]|nr:hypothetical protein HG530_008165 [Fusarium avenaceum]